MSQTAVVEQLKEKIRKLEAQPRQLVMALRTGLEELDAFNAFRLGTGVELCGEEASGRTTVALSVPNGNGTLQASVVLLADHPCIGCIVVHQRRQLGVGHFEIETPS